MGVHSKGDTLESGLQSAVTLAVLQDVTFITHQKAKLLNQSKKLKRLLFSEIYCKWGENVKKFILRKTSV